MICSYWVSQAVRAFADFSLADHLADGALTAPEVAAREQSAPETTLRLMRACVALGLLTVDANERFRSTPFGHTGNRSVDVAAHIDTTGVATAVDVGGANGSLLRLQQANPSLHRIVFDRPDVAAAVAPDMAGDRTQVIGGDFFQSVPAGDLLYLLKAILHDWDDESCVKILNHCRKAMSAGGRIAIVEMLAGEYGDAGPMPMLDLKMLAVLGGRERTLAEFDALLSDAGLRRIAVKKVDSPQRIIEAVA